MATAAAFGVLTDAVYGGFIGRLATRPSDLNLTTAWNVNVAYEHFWNPQLADLALRRLCRGELQRKRQRIALLVAMAPALVSASAVADAGCNMDWSTWWIGSRTQWNITKDFYMGFDTCTPNCIVPTFRPVGTLPSSAAVNGGSFPKDPTSTTGNSASACTAISIPDRG